MVRKMTRDARLAQVQVQRALAASATPPTPGPTPYAETLAFLERVAADFAAHADHDPVSADTVTYCRVAADAVRQQVEPPAAPRETGEVECTGLTATWCPKCGDCKCSRRDADELNDSACPLHSLESKHALPIAAPVRPVEGLSGRALAEAWDASTPQHGHAWANLSVSVRQHVCDFAERIAAPSAPQEPRGEPGEAVRMRPVSLRSDMGPQVLTAIIEDDGDVDLRLFDEQCGGISWQACVPGTGGGRYPHTLRALRALVHAMQIDAALSTGGRDASE